MKKRINLRLILIAGIAVIVTMVCMTGIYYKLFQGQVRKDLQINARLLSGTGLFDDPDKDAEMREHCGLHPTIMTKVANHDKYISEMHNFRSWIDPANSKTHGQKKKLLCLHV